MRKIFIFLCIIAVIAFAVIFSFLADKNEKTNTSSTKEPFTVVVNMKKFISDSLPLPITLNILSNHQLEFSSIKEIISRGKELYVSYNVVISKNDNVKKCNITLVYAFYISNRELFLSSIRTVYDNSSGTFLSELKANDEFLIGGIEEKWKTSPLQLPQNSNEIVEIFTNRIILK